MPERRCVLTTSEIEEIATSFSYLGDALERGAYVEAAEHAYDIENTLRRVFERCERRGRR